MRHRFHIIILSCQILLAAALWVSVVEAQEYGGWSTPVRLSSDQRKASEAYLAADQYGYVHVFWTEALPDERVSIRYARIEGETWSTPIDVHLTRPFSSVGNISPIVDSNGTLHIIWAETDTGPAYYTSAPANAATSAQQWQQPRRLAIPAKNVKLQVDTEGVLHVLYIKFVGQESGIYYTRSEDGGANWSDSMWLDPDILPGYGPRALNFELDDSDGLHAAWYYVPQFDTGGDWVRYAHSLDAGNTWSKPFTIDRLDEADIESGKQLSAAGPIMAVQGHTVHIIWAGGKLHYRNHRYSSDAGRTWSPRRRIFGDLNGQAFDGLTVDSAGRVHFFGQIRFPMAIYHAIWEDGHWSKPSLIYLIRMGSTDPIGDRIEAHDTHPAVLAGNQLVLTFADPPPAPQRGLFFMTRTLDDIAPITAIPTPLPATGTTPSPPPTPTLLPEATATPASIRDIAPGTTEPTPGRAIWLGIVSTLLLTGGTVLFRRLKS